jgi:hypothetical protein
MPLFYALARYCADEPKIVANSWVAIVPILMPSRKFSSSLEMNEHGHGVVVQARPYGHRRPAGYAQAHTP